MEPFEIALGIISIVSIGYGVWSDHKRTKLESYLQASVEAISKSLQLINQRSNWAKHHFDKIMLTILKIPDEETKEEAVVHAKDGRADAASIGVAHDIIQNQIKALPIKREESEPDS